MSQDLIAKAEKWINDSGYGLEMRSAAVFRAEGLPTIQADFYVDPETGTLRETDIKAYQPAQISPDQAAVVVVAECKRSSKPWILFCTERQFDPAASVQQRPATTRGSALLKVISGQARVQSLSLFKLPTFLGYSLVAASFDNADKGREGADRAYNGLLSVTSAATSSIRSLEEKMRSLSLIAWPLLILEGKLLQAVLGPGGKVEVSEVDRGVLAWRNPRLASHSFVSIVTEAALPAFVHDLAKDMHFFVDVATSELERLRGGG
jgi:hypothetical protein